MIDPKLTSTLETFHRAADDVAAVLGANSDWGVSGIRDGQYAVDLDADAACLDVLYGAGLRVLSEESGVTGPAGSESAPIVVVDPLDGSTNAAASRAVVRIGALSGRRRRAGSGAGGEPRDR